MLLSAALLLAGAAQAEERQGEVTWVGGDSRCDFSSLDDALAAADDGDEIRLATNISYFDAPYEIEHSISLAGGFPDCDSDSPDGRTTLVGGFSERVLRIASGISPALTVELSGLDVRGGSAEANGGGLTIGTGHEVEMSNMRFWVNASGARGGAIGVGFGASLVMSGDNEIDNNSADSRGGGVACLGGSEVKVHQGTIISNNEAEEGGGGIYAEGCEVRFHAGGPGEGIRDNETGGRGGGIFATNEGALLVLDGAASAYSDPSLPVSIRGNTAGSNDDGDRGGAGIALSDQAEAELINTVIADNESMRGPAAISAGQNTTIEMGSDPEAPCRDPEDDASGRCSAIVGNVATESNPSIVGGTGSTIDIRQSEIRANTITTGGILRPIRGTELWIENTLIAENSIEGVEDEPATGYLVNAFSAFTEDPVVVVVRFSTIAANDPDPYLEGDEDVVFRLGGNQDNEVELWLEGLVIDQPDQTMAGTIFDVGRVTRAACILAPEVDSLEDLATDLALTGQFFIENPLLVDPDAGNFRLSAESPAIDACALSAEPPQLIPPEFDLDGFRRGIAKSEEGEATPFDLGAFEFRVDELFKDRFEDNSS